ncbi:MAG: hypothetical protein IPI16_22290 [Comamonadaceae bacterium]|nr:hypothetical protein [Comamonadaceae bacterium]
MTTHVGSAIADGASVTIPAHQAGDLLVIFAARFDSTTIPTLPSGWTSAATQTGTDRAGRVGYRVATGSGTTSGTWTGAQTTLVWVLRDHGGIGAAAVDAATTLPALTLTGSSSWVGALQSGSELLPAVPSGMTSRANGSYDRVADTNGTVSSWASQFYAVDGMHAAVEVLGNAASTTDADTITLTDTAAVAASTTDADSITLTETATVLALQATADSDTITVTDTTGTLTVTTADSDTITVTETATVVETFRAVSDSDTITVTETATVASESQLHPAPRTLAETLAGSARIITTVVFLTGPAAGQSLPVIDGEVTVDDTSRVRRTCRLTVLASSEWVPTTVTHPLSLAQVSEWQIVQHLTLDDGTEMSWSQGVYHLTSPAVAHDSAGAFTITLEGADRAARAKLVGMQARWVGAAGGLVVPAVEAMLAAYCPWLPLGLTDLGHRLGGTQDMVLGEYGADLWDTAAQILTSVAGYSLHVDRDGVAVSPLILDPLADRVVAAWATGEGGMLGSLELGADITSIINEVGVPWEEPRPEGADSTWVPASGVEVAVDASSDYGTSPSRAAAAPLPRRHLGDRVGRQAAQVATSTLVRMQGAVDDLRARCLSTRAVTPETSSRSPTRCWDLTGRCYGSLD